MQAPAAFTEFYQSEYRAMVALARVLTGSLGRAEDLAQEAFAAAYSAWDTIERPEAWVRSVVANKARSMWRRAYRERAATDRLRMDPATSMPPDTEMFWAAVRDLPRRQAQAVALFYLEDRPVAEIADILGCAESTARVHLTRARRTLADRLEVTE